MVLTASAATASRLRVVRFAALVVLGSLVAHDLVVIVRGLLQAGQTGPVAHLASHAGHAGHGAPVGDSSAVAAGAHITDSWTLLTLIAIAAFGLGAAFGFTGVIRLTRAVRRLPSISGVDAGGGATGYLTELDHLWPRLFLAITVAFTLQENIAFAVAGHQASGAAILFCPAHPLAIPVLAGISLLLAIAGAWLRWRTTTLERVLRAFHAIRRFRSAVPSRPGRRWRLVAATVACRWLLLRRLAGRAPPAVAGA